MKKSIKTILAAFAACLLALPTVVGVEGVAEETETVLTSEIIVAGVTENINADKLGQMKDAGDYAYNLQYGTFDEIHDFTLIKPQNGLGSEEVYGNNNYTSAHINNGLVRVSEGFGLIYSLKVNADYKVTVTNPEASTLNSYLYPVYLDSFVFDGEYRVNVRSQTLPLEEKNVTVAANAISHEVHLKAGDTLYFVISADSMGRSINKFLPEFRLSKTGYDQTKRFDFADYKVFRGTAEALKTTLEGYFLTFDSALYSEDNYLKLVVVIDDAIKALDSVAYGTDLVAFEAEVKAKAEGILTKEGEAEALETLKQKRIGELESYVKELLKEGYSLLGKRDLKNCLGEGKRSVSAGKTSAEVNRAFNSAKAALLKVEKGSNLWLWLTIGGVVIAAGAGIVAVILLKKKKTR
ncbi:MAG: hypothetical protein IJY62_01055 [Clostridia bacterium]|nr:hypothetical protein [Clostridia bacterium]